MTAGNRLSHLTMTSVLVASTVIVASAAKDPTSSTCSSVAYRGFDSRLNVELLARVNLRGSPVTGFEVADGRPVIALERRLVGVDGSRVVSMPSIDRIDRMAVDASGAVWVQSGTNVRRLSKKRLEQVRSVEDGTRLYNSGNVAFLQTQRRDGATLLNIVSSDARQGLPPFRIEGEDVSSATWNSVGLAAAAGDTLIAWPAGSPKVIRLRRDDGLRSARDVSLVAPDRAVVALPGTLALVTDRGVAVLALMHARVRWANNALYVLDQTLGLVWKISGVERLGSAESDNAHVMSILKQLPRGASETDTRFLEAARIVGCQGARASRDKAR
jgi:hypothetical protein